MSDKKPLLTYAINSDGNLVHINDVPKGLECNCFCPSCKSELIAKNEGSVKRHHFAHKNGSDCVNATESALHIMAKDILQKNKCVMLPPNSYEKQLSFIRVETEKIDQTLNLRPDCVGYDDNSNATWIEFKRTHEVDLRKASKIISAKINCIEIDLNNCPLIPTAVKNFIENSCDDRKWIYNKYNPQEYNYTQRKSPKYQPHTYYQEPNYPRHIAVDENGVIVILRDINQINTIEHKYYCIACGHEVYISVDDHEHYSFKHISVEECGEDLYLYEATKNVFQKLFNDSIEFNLAIPQLHICAKKNQCPLFDNNLCTQYKPSIYDLKAHGYISCDINYKFPDAKFPCIAILNKNNDTKSAIIVTINTNSCYIEPDNITNRTITLYISYESDIINLYNKNLRNSTYYNFKTKTPHISNNIYRDIIKFILYSSGKYFFGYKQCDSITTTTKIVSEFIFIQDIPTNELTNAKLFAIIECHLKNKRICKCEICYYCKTYDSNLSICSRYKTKRTPKYPLELSPNDCPYFSIDRNLYKLYQSYKLRYSYISTK